ncbi:MAG: hypothetical protein QXR62_04770 [Candidatus Bathyarchaeia archaeon]
MDRVIFMLEMTAGDLALIYQLARNDRMTVNEWIMKCIMEKVEKLQEEWQMKQKIKPLSPGNSQPQPGREEESAGEKKRRRGDGE